MASYKFIKPYTGHTCEYAEGDVVELESDEAARFEATGYIESFKGKAAGRLSSRSDAVASRDDDSGEDNK